MKLEIFPFVKWAGGKRQLLPLLTARLPREYNDYYEPFIGGGALFFEVQPKHGIINDVNLELVTTYNAIKNSLEQITAKLSEMEKNHIKSPKEYFYEVRSWDRHSDWFIKDDVTKSARFIYLNKACFNGLYRVNSKGFFNVPFNNKIEIKSYDLKNLKNISQYLNDSCTKILNEDFEVVCSNAKKGDFIYFDPPYDLLKEDTFDSYTKTAFGKEGQIRLAELFKELDRRGCYVMLSNHDTPFIRELYAGFKIELFQVKRMINSDSSKREGEEVIVRNYDNEEPITLL
jgi:DNA adenine methylase